MTPVEGVNKLMKFCLNCSIGSKYYRGEAGGLALLERKILISTVVYCLDITVHTRSKYS